MTCTHLNGGLQILIYRQGSWFSHCLCCGADQPEQDVSLSPEAGRLASLAALDMKERRFGKAAEGFARAAQEGGDPRCHMAALLCRLGVSWCGDEYQPTFHAALPPRTALEDTPEWQALSRRADELPAFAWQGLTALRKELEAILTPLRAGEGRRGCDVFLCYRRTPANVQSAIQLCQDLRRRDLRVFCADISTRGKTQEEFEAEVGHALRTAEYMVIFPGDGPDALSPWMLNELERAACPAKNRFVASDNHAELPAGLGSILSLQAIGQELASIAASCTAEQLWARGVNALKDGDAPEDALRLLERASSRKHQPSRLLLATLFEEGLLLPADALRAEHYRRLAGMPDERCRQMVFATLGEIEQARHIARRRAVIYIAVDVSDAGLAASQAMLRPLMAALQADRRLALSDVCLVGYDRHARIIEAPKAMEKFGLPENAARMLHTLREAGRDQQAFAAKGLRLCAADQLSRASDQLQPLAVLLSTGAGSDAPGAVEAALASVSAVFPNHAQALLASAQQIPACIAGLLAALR